MPFSTRHTLAAALLLAGAAAAQAQTTANESVLRACTPAETRATQRFWPLQNHVMLDFAVSGSNYTLANNPANTAAETNSAVTDASGQLQFFVDGGSIYRADGTVMPNGSGLKARPSAEQSSVAFANPAKKGEYYVFTNNTVTGGFSDPSSDRSWYYSVVDMNANGGLGAVTAKNVAVAATAGKSSEAMTAVPNAAGDGFWVVGIELNTNKIMAFEVKASGVGAMVESTMGYTDASVYTSLAFNGDGSKLVAQNRQYPTGPSNISVMEFDRASGTASNPIVWPVSGLGDYYNLYSAAFSPDSQSLYVASISSNGTSFLYSYDLSSGNAATIAGTQRRITRTGGYGGALRIGADGALWWANGVTGTKASDYLYRLPTPNTRPAAGATIGVFEQLTVNGGQDYSALGLTQTLPSCFADPVPPEITITKTSSTPGPVAAGAQVDYTVTVANVGTVVAPQLHLSDAFPAGLKSASWTCSASGGAPAQACAAPAGSATAPAALLDQTFDLQPGATVSYQITALADAAAVISTENTATATVPGGAACSQGGAQQSSCSATTPGNSVSPKPEITIAKTSSTAGPVAAGGSVSYTITVANVGMVAAAQLQLNDAFPPGLVSASWTCSASGGTPAQACAAPAGSAAAPAALLNQTFDLQPGGTVSYQITAQAGSSAVASTENTATATVPGGAACSQGGAQQSSCSATTPKGQTGGGSPGTPAPVPANAPWALLALGAAAAWLGRRALR